MSDPQSGTPEVPRYTQIGGVMVVSFDTFLGNPTGDWVRHSDYAAAQARITALTEQLTACGEMIIKLEAECDHLTDRAEQAESRLRLMEEALVELARMTRYAMPHLAEICNKALAQLADAINSTGRPTPNAATSEVRQESRESSADENAEAAGDGSKVPQGGSIPPRPAQPADAKPEQSSCAVVFGPEQQDYPGGPIYRVGTSTGVTLPTQPAAPQEKPEQAWQPIETAPRDGSEVIILVESRAGVQGKCLVGHYMPGGHCIEDHPPIDEGWYFWSGHMFDRASKPILWMPLPAHPTPASGQQEKE